MWQSGSQGASLWRVSFEQFRGDFDRRRLYYGTGVRARSRALGRCGFLCAIAHHVGRLGTPATSVTVLPARRSELL